MKKLKNTLYILTPGSYLYCQNEAICVKIGGEERARVPSHTIESIICICNTTVSSPFLGFCAKRCIVLTFLDDNGRFYGQLHGYSTGNIMLRRRQFAALDNIYFCEQFSKNVVLGKIANSRDVLMKAKRSAKSDEKAENIKSICKELSTLSDRLSECETTEEVRGIEAVAAKAYFSAFDSMLKCEQDMKFVKRSRRPPENDMNALMSFLYALLKNDIVSALTSVGLDAQAGFMHTLRPGRPSLALDMMEELRSPLCDRLAVSLVNKGQISSSDFSKDDLVINLSDKGRRTVIKAWQNRKQEKITHSFLNDKIPIGLIPFIQAQLLTHVLYDELDEYPPFRWRN